MTDKELDELEELEKRATPAPWGWEIITTNPGKPKTLYAGHEKILNTPCGAGGCDHPRMEDAQLISALRNSAPKLIDEVKRLRTIIEEYVPCQLNGKHQRNPTFAGYKNQERCLICGDHISVAQVEDLK